MRIISWNCNRAFRKKYKDIKSLDADIYVIQECENPETVKDEEYKEFAQNCIWVGYKNRGLGIFAKNNVILKDNCWQSYGLEWFVSCTVNNEFSLLGIWASGNYIEDIYVYFQIHKDKFKNILICGDFNSNSCWDKKHKWKTHTAVVKELENLDLYSSYHLKEREVQGKESQPTFFLYRNKEKKYHIDYCFYYKEKVDKFYVGEFEEWIKLSDHMPIILDAII